MKHRQTTLRILFSIIFISLLLAACSSAQSKLDWQDSFPTAKTESKNGFFNIEPGQETINIKSQVNLSSGSLEYRLSDAGGMAVYAGILHAGDKLDETFPLVAIKGNYIFYIFIEEAVGDYHFTIIVE